MFKRLRALIRGIEIQPLSLKFEMDVDEVGNHIVKVYRQAGNNLQEVKYIQQLWNYGFREEIKTEERHVIRILKDDDRQTLLALKSLNPIIREDNALVFEIEPPVLKYLRRKDNIAETAESQQVKIGNKPVLPTARVSFDPQAGLKVETGYALGSEDKLIASEAIKRSKDGHYARIGNLFAPLEDVSAEAKVWLTIQSTLLLLKTSQNFSCVTWFYLKRI